MRVGDFLLLVVSGTLAAAAAGLALSGWAMAALLTAVTPVLAVLYLKFRAGRRRAAFADQLDDSLQLLAGSLRAGHSLLRALDAVSREAEEPTSTEFSRVINETRVGRPLGDSLDDTAQRMSSDDFTGCHRPSRFIARSAATSQRCWTRSATPSGNATASAGRSKRSAPRAGCPALC